jgi:hypothetical protein
VGVGDHHERGQRECWDLSEPKQRNPATASNAQASRLSLRFDRRRRVSPSDTRFGNDRSRPDSTQNPSLQIIPSQSHAECMLMSHRFKELWREPKTYLARRWGRGEATKFPRQSTRLPASASDSRDDRSVRAADSTQSPWGRFRGLESGRTRARILNKFPLKPIDRRIHVPLFLDGQTCIGP